MDRVIPITRSNHKNNGTIMRNLPRRGAHGLLLIAVLSGACGNEAPPAPPPPAVELEPIAWERNYVDSFQPRH